MSDKGFFVVDRGLFDHWVWSDRPYAKGQAWIDLIGLANHKDTKRVKNGETIIFKRGTVNRSMKELADRWGWNRKQVKKFLLDLEADQMVSVKATRTGSQQGTRITLINYGRFQISGTRIGTQIGTRKGHGCPTDVPRMEHKQRMTKNDNNEKNDVLRFRASDQPPTLEEVRDYFKAAGLTTSPERFWRHYDENGWTLSGGGKVRSWKKAAQSWKEDWPHGEETRGTDRGDRNPRQRAGYGEAEAELFGQMS